MRDGPRLALEEVLVSAQGHPESTAAHVVARWGTRSLVVVHDGALLVDWTTQGHDSAAVQRCYSITKSLTGTILAELVVRGDVARSDVVADVLPALGTSGFADATVGELADMTVELAYLEDYAEIGGGSSTGRGHDFGDYVVALGMHGSDAEVDVDAARTIRSLLPRIGRGEGPHGSAFHYATPVTDVIGWLVEAVTGRSVVDHVTELIWLPSGASTTARWDTDLEGVAQVAAGLWTSTNDLARIGLLLAERTRGQGDPSAVSPEALKEVRIGGSTEVFASDEHYAYLTGYSYRDQWWIPAGPEGAFSGWGIFGQFLWVDPEHDVVIAGHGRAGLAGDPDRDVEQHALCAAIVDAVAS